MKKRIIALAALFVISAAFGGCKENGGQENQSETSATSAQTTEVSEPSETEADSDTEEDKKEEEKVPEPKGLKANTSEQNEELIKKLSELKDGDGNYIFDKTAEKPQIRRIVSEDEISVSEFYAADLYRESTNMLCSDTNNETHMSRIHI